jgi:hypothetical protein
MRGDSEEGAPASDQQEVRTVILLVADPNDSNHPQATLFDDPADTARAIEDLLQAGLEEERLSVFFGTKAEILVSFRPVVDFTDDGREDCGQPAAVGTGVRADATRGGQRFSHLFRSAEGDTA